MTRNHAVFLAALLGMSGLSSMAYAQVCEDDFDCATGTLCVFEGGGDGDVAVDAPAETPVCDGDGCPEPDPTPTPTPRTGKCEPLPKGLCVMQSDCTLGLTCVIGTIGTDCAEPAPVDQGGDEPVDARDECTPNERPAPYGYCTLPETKCTTDAQCLLGLKCVASSSGGTPGATDPACAADDPECGVGSDPAPEPAPEPKDAELTCEVAFDDCASNSDCATGYACVERATGCSSGGSTGSGGSVDPVAPDEPSAAIPKQNDPNCEYESKCLPKLVPCDNDTQCQSGWTCYAYEADSPVAEVFWEQSAAGKACLPKGLALAAEASAAADFAGGKDDSATGSPEAGSDGDESAGAGEGGGGGGGMCAVSAGPSNAGALWLLALSLGLVIRRRRA